MSRDKEHIPAGAEVPPGVYRCNACANECECTEKGEKLPVCRICDSVSWRASRLFDKAPHDEKS